nr:sugar kinase [Halobacillus shinanisalinarum]
MRTFYYRENSPTLSMIPEDLDETYIKQADILHITGIFPAIDDSNIPVLKEAVRLAKKNGVKVSFDPNIRLKLWNKTKARETLAPLLAEVDILLGEKEPEKIIARTRALGIPFVALKRGELGSIGYDPFEEATAEPVPAAKVVDTVGAGDGFNAGVLYGILQGWPLKKVLHFGNKIGSMVVGVKGDSEGLPYYEEVQEV